MQYQNPRQPAAGIFIRPLSSARAFPFPTEAYGGSGRPDAAYPVTACAQRTGAAAHRTQAAAASLPRRYVPHKAVCYGLVGNIANGGEGKKRAATPALLFGRAVGRLLRPGERLRDGADAFEHPRALGADRLFEQRADVVLPSRARQQQQQQHCKLHKITFLHRLYYHYMRGDGYGRF